MEEYGFKVTVNGHEVKIWLAIPKDRGSWTMHDVYGKPAWVGGAPCLQPESRARFVASQAIPSRHLTSDEALDSFRKALAEELGPSRE